MRGIASVLASLLLTTAGCSGAASRRETASELVVRADLAYTQDRDARASLELLDRAITLDPDHVPARLARAGLRRLAGRRVEAIDDLDHVLRLDPRQTTARAARGIALTELGRTLEAERDFVSITEGDPESPDGWLLRAWLYRRTGRYTEAIRDQAVARAKAARLPVPDRWRDYYRAGAAALREERWADAERNFEVTLMLEPGVADAHVGLSRVRVHSGSMDGALEELRRAAVLRPDEASIAYARAELLRASGRHSEATALYDQAIATGASTELGASLTAMMHVGRGSSLEALGQIDLAARDYDRAITLDPRLREAYVARARLRRKAGDGAAARADFEAALALQASAELMIELAGLEEEAKRPDRALTLYEAAIRICDDPELRSQIESRLGDRRRVTKDSTP